jgi:hypothetical protein
MTPGSSPTGRVAKMPAGVEKEPSAATLSKKGARHHDGETAPPARRRCGDIGQRPAHPSQRAIRMERCPDAARLPRRRRSRCARQRRDRDVRRVCAGPLSWAVPLRFAPAVGRGGERAHPFEAGGAVAPGDPIACQLVVAAARVGLARRRCRSAARVLARADLALADQVTSARCSSKWPARRSAK